MAWPVEGTNGWVRFGTPIDTEPQRWELPVPVYAYYYDPTPLHGAGTPVDARVLEFGGGTVTVRERLITVEAEFFLPYLWSDGLLDQFAWEPSEPCALVLDVFDDDRVTVLWSVGTSQLHSHPYLIEPESYGEQEVDVASGSASIGTVSVSIIDPTTIPGDQDSGWFTGRLARNGLPDVVGRRARLRRFISTDLGYQTIADGPAASPALDPSYAAFGFSIRDTRETERKVRIFEGGGGMAGASPGVAFDPTGVKTLLPDAVWGGYGFDPISSTYLVDPAQPLLGKAKGIPFGLFDFSGGLNIFGNVTVDLTTDPGNATALRTIGIATARLFEGEIELVGAPFVSGALTYQDYITRFPALNVYWRAQGTTDEWSIIAGDLQLTGRSLWESGSATTAVRSLIASTAYPSESTETGRLVTSIVFGGSLPDPEQDIELIVVYRGPPSKDAPVYLEGLTAGELARNVYAGLYSRRDADGFVVPTGIRYDEDAVLQMTDVVRMRVFAAVGDARDWLEKCIYAPTGWAPALDRFGEISPVSQIAPTSAFGLTTLTNRITEASPDWNGGERIVNVLRFTYQRDYRPANPKNADTGDGLAQREIVIEWEDPISVERMGRVELDIDGVAFSAIGNPDAEPVSGDGTLEAGFLLSQLRQIHVQNRYTLGAPTISVAVMRSAIPLARAGDWFLLDLTWLPDYVTSRRGLIALAQIVALGDLDCGWRKLLLEVVVPVVEGS